MEIITFFVGLCFWFFGVIGFAHVLKNGFRWPTRTGKKGSDGSGSRPRFECDEPTAG